MRVRRVANGGWLGIVSCQSQDSHNITTDRQARQQGREKTGLALGSGAAKSKQRRKRSATILGLHFAVPGFREKWELGQPMALKSPQHAWP